jgi:restriction endonuclease S subunit
MSDAWNPLTLGDVAAISTGSRDRGGALNEGIPSIGGEHISVTGEVAIHKGKYVSPEHYNSMNAGHLSPGDVLMVKDGATTGKIGLWTSQQPAAVNEHVFILRARRDLIEPYFLYLLVQSPLFQAQLRPHVRGVIGGITRGISELTISLPSIATQRRIVDLMEHLDRHLSNLRAEQDSAEDLLASCRTFAFSELGERGTALSLGELTASTRPICYGVLQPLSVAEGVPLVRIQDMAGDFLDGSSCSLISEEMSSEYARSILNGREVLVSIRGTLGRVALCPSHLKGANISRDVALIEPDSRVEAAYLRHALIWRVRRGPWESGGSTRPSLNIGDLRNTEVPVPAIHRQREIVGLLDAQESVVRSLQSEAKALARLRVVLLEEFLSKRITLVGDHYDNQFLTVA